MSEAIIISIGGLLCNGISVIVLLRNTSEKRLREMIHSAVAESIADHGRACREEYLNDLTRRVAHIEGRLNGALK